MLWLKLVFISFVAFIGFPKISYTEGLSDSLKTQLLLFENSTNEFFTIDEIRILGNHRTLPETILHEINLSEKHYFKEEDLKYFESRIFSLGIFSDVKVFLSKEAEKMF